MRRLRALHGSAIVAVMAALMPVGVAGAQTPSPPPIASPAPHGASPAPTSGSAEDPRCEDLGLVDLDVSAAPLRLNGTGRSIAQEDPVAAMCGLAPWVKAAWPLKIRFPGGWYVPDAAGDSPESATDILGVGIAPVNIAKGGLRKSFRGGTDVTVTGKTKKAQDGFLVFVQTAGTPGAMEGKNPSWTIATDRDGDPWNNVPVSVDVPDNPFANTQNAFHLLYYANGSPFVGVSDLAGQEVNGSRFYNDAADVAAAALPDGVAFLIPAGRLGSQIRVISSVDGQADTVSLPADGAQIPLDGRVPATLGCTEREVAHQPLTVNEVRIDGEPFADVPFPSFMTIGECKKLDLVELGSLGGLPDDLAVWVTTKDPDGLTIEQHVPVDWWADEERFYLLVDIGLTKYGRTAVVDVAFDRTGADIIDELLSDNAAYLEWRLGPLAVDERQGRIGSGECVPPRPA